MIQGIKYALAFLCGGTYASCIWCVTQFDGDWLDLPIITLVFSSAAIVIVIFWWIGNHWNDDDK